MPGPVGKTACFAGPTGSTLPCSSSSRFPRRTAKGHATYRRILGFSEYLPYAVVFGATEKWASAFAGVDGQLPETTWYFGAHPFTMVTFGVAMNSFATTTSGTIASVPASSGSSGFSSGGGFSGGGFGGGGGGAW